MFRLSCQNFSLDGTYAFQEMSLIESMKLADGKIIFEYDLECKEKTSEIITFELKHIYGLPFLVLSKKMPMEVASWIDLKKDNNIQTDNKILFLSMKDKSNITMFAYTKGYSFNESLTYTRFNERGNTFKDCSSFLVEKTKSYPVENLRNPGPDTPWVEGVSGDGIGEGFTIWVDEENNSQKSPAPYLLIINDYISYDKPYLYKQNNRVKKLKVTGLKSGKSKILNVLDTPHPQTIDISFIPERESLRVEIEDVYHGSKYDDTCINYLILHTNEVIPYENSILD